jgi:glycosyltransferase involved in cell wall biosynthesis
MRCPTLKDLPPPPSGKIGWPWTEESPYLPNMMCGGTPWPRISIVTPSYDQGAFIEETIRSVLLQGYPNMEYLVIDGGSTNGSRDIIEKYAPWLSYWVSEPDRGQPHAINKGFERCTGDLLGWLNSDDVLLPGAAGHFAEATSEAPGAILMADVIHTFEGTDRHQLLRQRNVTFDKMVEPWRHDLAWCQPGVYVARTLHQQIGPLDETLQLSFDRDWMCRLLEVAPVHYLGVPVANFRIHADSKGTTADFFEEESIITKRYWHKVAGFDVDQSEAALAMYHAVTRLRLRHWNRRAGLASLAEAFRRDRRVLAWPKFWLLLAKALAPFVLLQALRALHLRFSKRVLCVAY